jgi:hypothetical protein
MMKDGRWVTGGGSLFITGPPATFLVYKPRCSIRTGDRAAPNLQSDKCTALLRPLNLAQLKPELGTLQPAPQKSSKIRRTGRGKGEEKIRNGRQLTN